MTETIDYKEYGITELGIKTEITSDYLEEMQKMFALDANDVLLDILKRKCLDCAEVLFNEKGLSCLPIKQEGDTYETTASVFIKDGEIMKRVINEITMIKDAIDPTTETALRLGEILELLKK